ncbi:MAG: ATP-grasp domain-containing protein [archaeon]
MNKSSMKYWYPKIKKLNIPQPKTIILDFGANRLWEFVPDVKIEKRIEEEENKKVIFKIKENAKKLGYPFFMRTDHCSAKHSYNKTCYVSKEEDILRNLVHLIEENELMSFMSFNFEAVILREFIKLEHYFTAFQGLPIAKERRYFVRDGKIEEHFPYWIEDAISSFHNPSEKKWKELLKKINKETDEEVALLSKYAEMVGKEIEGYWSVDFAKGIDDKWYLIDMAEGEKSFNPRLHK